MQSFRTKLNFSRAPFALSYEHQTLGLGSCFAVHIGRRLQKYKFPVQNNPFGILYNPASMRRAIERLRSGEPYGPDDLFEQNGLWSNFDFHGSFSHFRPETALEAMNRALQSGRAQLAGSRRLILTFGTAFVFEHLEQEKIVANCHKVPASQFRRYRLGVEDIVTPWVSLLEELKKDQPDLRVILSVSPVRHLRDGLVENQRSKATLALALEEICRRLDYAHYFPAYELLLDDLRDYRFYDRDLSHPNDLAVDYIWDHFRQTYFDETTDRIFQQVQKIVAGSEHRPLHPGSPGRRQFVAQQLDRIQNLRQTYPFLDFSEEIGRLEER